MEAQTKFSGLRELHLRCIVTPEATLLALLGANRETLRTLSLALVILKDGCWMEAIQALQTNLSLSAVCFNEELLSKSCDWFCYPQPDGEYLPWDSEDSSPPTQLVGKNRRFPHQRRKMPTTITL